MADVDWCGPIETTEDGLVGKAGGGQDRRDSAQSEAGSIPQPCRILVKVCSILDSCTAQRSILRVALGLYSRRNTGAVPAFPVGKAALAWRIDCRFFGLSSAAMLQLMTKISEQTA